jgi:hypothetical protein
MYKPCLEHNFWSYDNEGAVGWDGVHSYFSLWRACCTSPLMRMVMGKWALENDCLEKIEVLDDKPSVTLFNFYVKRITHLECKCTDTLY